LFEYSVAYLIASELFDRALTSVPAYRWFWSPLFTM
jgi:hypothetical protein